MLLTSGPAGVSTSSCGIGDRQVRRTLPIRPRGWYVCAVCAGRRNVTMIVSFLSLLRFQAWYGPYVWLPLFLSRSLELLIVLAMLKTPGALIVCNGYKDSEYM